ncbi:hypothetical protein V1506DRAFT_514342 [Lipomyces tetrasporus]
MPISNGPLSARPSMQSTRSAPLLDDTASDLPCTCIRATTGVRYLFTLSEVALENMTADELSAHVQELERVKIEASTVLAYWIDQRNSSAEDKTKYEVVIESSIEYAQRLRRHTTRVAAIPGPLSRNKSVTR